jgi:hypothetical protein
MADQIKQAITILERMVNMIIHIEYIPILGKWVLTIDGKWIITSVAPEFIGAALQDYLPVLFRTVTV